MKNFCLLGILIFSFSVSKAQLADGSTAPDFTFIDIYGNTQNLYSYLNQGKYVAIDVSATWCQPCWNYHVQGALDSLYEEHDVPGDNTWKVIFFEADGSTDSADLYGATTNSQGNWVQGSNYMIIDPPTGIDLSNFQNVYEFSSYPTLYLICPDKKVLTSMLNGNPRATLAMWKAAADDNCWPAGIDNFNDTNPLTIYPNPTVGTTTLYFSIHTATTMNLTVSTMLGQVVDKVHYQVSPGDQSLKYTTSHLEPGLYILSLSYTGGRTIAKKVLVQ